VTGHPEFGPQQMQVSAWPEIRRTLEAEFLKRPSHDWMAMLDEAGTQAMLVLEPAEAVRDPHNQARGMVPVYEASGGVKVQHIGPPIKLSETPAEFRHLAHTPGQDDCEIRAALA
jgi:crotonobetainyl-CoA:carnitine CoA-transferase CaiB-like acyl-CoA transferase